MAVNGTGTFHRTRLDEDEDVANISRNILAQSWKDWPNEAAFDNLEEHRGPIPLKVVGDIPAWAAGALYRTGPGQSRVDGTAKGTHYVSHWFDGFAQTHRFDIDGPSAPGGKTTVTYSSRRQSDDYVARVKKKGWRSGISFGQRADPCVGLFAKVMSVFEPKLTTYNVTVQLNVPGMPAEKSGHRTGVKNLYIGTDVGAAMRVDPASLEPLGPASQSAFHRDLKGPMSSAHAQRDPENGDLFNFNLDFGRVPTYRVFRVNAASGKTDILATVADLPAAYIHSFFLTASFVVLCVPSSHLQWGGAGIVWHRNILDALEPFDESKRCRWIVVDRRHGKGVVARFSTPAGFFFHSVNSFEKTSTGEKGDRVTELFLDYIEYANFDVLKGFYYDVILNRRDAAKEFWTKGDRTRTAAPRFVRYKFTMPQPGAAPDMTYSATAERALTIRNPHAGDLPTIHPLKLGKPYRYAYSTPNRGLNTLVDALAKTDVETASAVLWTGPRGHMPGEPIFVPRPGGTAEDDGVVLSVVVDSASSSAYLLCLDAATMLEIGRAKVDFALPMGFHGAHVAASA
ncbi:torulene oxygenase [Dactylonectria estremocensis]|uniref:Torulene oxygenase n=1 Tax=Dactylonectria estremocensis TaxID=1079267 RepID=A0A9P9DN51_9HYPO|nr:torulene oxygenase [Dactylonectria estremocensis]